MSIIKLRDWAADKRKFVKVRDYLDFAEAFVEFREKAGNIQAELVARNTPQYRFFQYNSEADYLISRPINTQLFYEADQFLTSRELFLATLDCIEAYSVAGETWFGWWLVEHYLQYHVNRPNSCDSGEPARGRKDPPYFQMSYGSFDHIPDLVDPFVESLLPA